MNKKKIALLAVIPFALPERGHIPVRDASSRDWNKQSFW